MNFLKALKFASIFKGGGIPSEKEFNEMLEMLYKENILVKEDLLTILNNNGFESIEQFYQGVLEAQTNKDKKISPEHIKVMSDLVTKSLSKFQ
jgi:hypothetical protein